MDFETILKATQKQLKFLLAKELRQQKYKTTVKDGFIYAKGSIPVLLVAHMDTVHASPPKIICYSEDNRFIMSPYGIGGDDRCGIYMILEIIKLYKCHVLFTEDEEIGGHGALKFISSNIKPNVNYIVEFDRKGANDCVFYEDDNKEFHEFVESFGFKTAKGSFSDISLIAPKLGISAVNLSCGYFSPHTNHELIDMKIINNNIDRSISMIASDCSKFAFKQVFEIVGECLHTQKIQFIDDGYVILSNGAIVDGYDYCIDKFGNVYRYDFYEESLIKVKGEAFTICGFPFIFDDTKAEEVINL